MPDIIIDHPVLTLALGVAVALVIVLVPVYGERPRWLINAAAFFAVFMCLGTAAIGVFALTIAQSRGDAAVFAAASETYDAEIRFKDIADVSRRSIAKESVWIIDGDARVCTLEADVEGRAHPEVTYVAIVCDGTELTKAP